jgi:hypothetical protein
VILSQGAADACALWSVHAHALDAAQAAPRLNANSPTERCGKTILLGVMGLLVPRPLPTSNISTSAIYRAVEAAKPTLLIDEADTFLKKNEEIRGIINSGHTRASAFVIRNVDVNGSIEPRRFSTWVPMVIAGIKGLPRTIADRSITIPMRRKRKSEKVEKHTTNAATERLQTLARRSARWAADHLQELSAAEPVAPEALNDRAADSWAPLLAIADVAGGEWPERARKAALELSGEDAVDDPDNIGTTLLADIRAIFAAIGAKKLSSKELVSALVAMENREWAEFGHAKKPITAHRLSALLRPFDIRPKTIRISNDPTAEGDTPQGYRLSDFADAFSRYLPEQAPQNPTSQHCSDFNDLHEPQNPTVADHVGFQNAANPLKDQHCWDVGFQKGGSEPSSREDVAGEAPMPPPRGADAGKTGRRTGRL